MVDAPSDPNVWLRGQLPPPQLAILEAIEARQMRPIGVSLRTDPVSPTDPKPNGPACFVDSEGGHIQFRNWESPEIAGITHELLHLERYVLNGVPQIVPNLDTEGNWQITSEIENCLEHLVIIPMERDRFNLDTDKHWSDVRRQNWERLTTANFEDSVRRRHLLMAYLSLSRASDPETQTTAHALLDRHGLRKDADNFVVRMRKLMGLKASQLACVCRFCGISPKDVEMAQYVPGKGLVYRPLPLD